VIVNKMETSHMVTKDISDQIADVVATVTEGMVKISNGHSGAGAGSIIHPQGLIVTNSHVVQSREVSVYVERDRAVKGKLLARNKAIDLAIIVVEENDLPVISMGDSSTARAGELVFSLGYPWGIEGGLTYGVWGIEGGLTYGVVIQVGPWPTEYPRTQVDLLTASLHLRPGHSGGPMFNSRGEIIGLNTMMQGPDVGVAVPINRAKRFIKDALEGMS
jgi:serine protease Do